MPWVVPGGFSAPLRPAISHPRLLPLRLDRALRDVECRDRSSKTLQLQVSEVFEPREHSDGSGDTAADQYLPVLGLSAEAGGKVAHRADRPANAPVEPLESTDAPSPKSFKKGKRSFASSWLRRILRQRRCSGQGAGQAQCGRTRSQKECWPLTRGSSP